MHICIKRCFQYLQHFGAADALAMRPGSIIMNCDRKSESQRQSLAGKVLLVDNGESAWPQVTGLLEQVGLQTTQTPCRSEASEALASKEYSAVIIHQNTAPDSLTAFCRTARAGNEQLVIIPAVIACDESLELKLFASGVDDIVTDTHTPQALAKRIAVRIANRQRMN
jgi:DNA-binding response OmpR family regulator